MVAAAARVREARSAWAATVASRELRRAQLSFGAAWTSEWAFTVGLSIIAFHDGGTAAVGLVALVRLAPSAIVGPLAGTLADRFRRDLVLGWIGIIRAAAIGSAAVLLVTVSSRLPVYGLALVATTALTPFRAAHSALLPTLCRDPGELTSAMAVRGLLDSASVLLGPLIAAALLAVSGPGAVLVFVAGASALSALVVLGLRYEAPPRRANTMGPTGLLGETVEGVMAVGQNRDLSVLFAMAAGQVFTRGCLTVFSVVISIDLLGLGDSGVGVLSAAVGVGAVLGSLTVSLLVASRRLGEWLSVSIALWGAPLILVAAFPTRAATLVLLAVIGVANALEDVALFTLMGRLVDDQLLARVFGVFESMIAIAVGVGSVVTPAVVDELGIRGALVTTGCLCPALAVLGWARLRILDRTLDVRTREIELLRAVPMLRVLPAVTIEQLARAVRRVRVPAGQNVCVQGSAGDTFYVVDSGEAEVLGDGRLVRRLGPGDSFGEIALLRDVARTATVRAATDLELAELTRELFIPLVSGYGASAREAQTTVADRLAAYMPAPDITR